MDQGFAPRLGQQAWTIVTYLRGGDRLRFDTTTNVYTTYDPNGVYADKRFPSSAVRQLVTEGVLNENLEPTAEGHNFLDWDGVKRAAVNHEDLDHEGVVSRVRIGRTVQVANLDDLERQLAWLRTEIEACPVCRAVGNTTRF